jgi:hypothetical protein
LTESERTESGTSEANGLGFGLSITSPGILKVVSEPLRVFFGGEMCYILLRPRPMMSLATEALLSSVNSDRFLTIEIARSQTNG